MIPRLVLSCLSALLALLSTVSSGPPPISPTEEEWVVEYPSFEGRGIPPNSSYTQKRTSLEEIVSVPGCPKSIDGYPFVLYREQQHDDDPNIPNPPAKCYLVGEYYSGCSGFMHYVNGSDYGKCQDHPPSTTPYSADYIQPGSCQEGYFWSEHRLSCVKRFGKGSPFYVG